MLKRCLTTLLLLACTTALAAVSSDKAYVDGIRQWRENRVARLKAPDGWLSLVGLIWLEDGKFSLGSAEGSGVRLPGGPGFLGTLRVDKSQGRVELALGEGVQASLGDTGERQALLRPDTEGKPTLVRCGSLSFLVIKRGEKLGLRVRDSEARSRLEFPGIETYPTDVSWRVEARWVPYEPARKIAVTNVLGQVSEEIAPGKAVFERDGKTYELTPTQEEQGGELFFVFRDETSGLETYGASRFLTAEPARDGKVILDFNKAYNPPCAFSPFATCPLPTRDNILKLAIRAGEKMPAGHE